MIARLVPSTPARAMAFAAVVALLWLNQSSSAPVLDAGWDAAEAKGPVSFALYKAHYPFLFLYRRSRDEELYFATSSAVMGQPYDKAVLAARGDSPLPPVSTPVDGHFHVPYAEVPFEYPPPNVALVLLPRLFAGSWQTYAFLFSSLMGVLLLASAWLGVQTARLGRASDDTKDDAARIFAFGLLLLAHGGIAIQRLDAFVALLAILMVRSAVKGDERGLGFWGGLIGATKFIPLLMWPVLLVAAGIREPKRLFRSAVAAFVGVLVGLGPMLWLGFDSLPLVLKYHSMRGLHVESSLGVVYGAAKVLLGDREMATNDFGSSNFHGPVSVVLAKAATVATFALIGLVAWYARPAPGTPTAAERAERIVLAALGTLGALWLGGKVFSPQYLTWAIPLVIALPDAKWKKASFWLGVVLVISQVYLRGYYDHVYEQRPAGVITMVVRLAVLVGLYVVTLRELRRPHTAAVPSPAAAS